MVSRKSISLEKARDCDKRVRALVEKVEKTWVAIAQECAEMKKHRWYRDLGFTAFPDWMQEAVGRRKSTIYDAMGAIERLADDVSAEDLRDMTLENAKALSKVAPSKRRQLIEQAKREPGPEFRRSVNRVQPGTVDEKGSYHFEVWLEDKEELDVAERAIERAKILEATDSRAAAFERIVSDFLTSHEEPEAERAALERIGAEQAAVGAAESAT
jgi:hypothetical protein